MSEYRYTFDKSNKKHPCPECNKKTFVLYIDTETGDYLPDQYGRCDRESKCSYHSPPPPEPQETKCLLVPFSKFIDYSKKAYQITTKNGIYYLPKSMVFEQIDNGFYVSEWYLSKQPTPPGFLNDDCRFYLKGELVEPPNNLKETKPAPKVEPVFIPNEVLRQTLKGYEQNVFIQNLLNRVEYPFETKDVQRVISQYYLGTICEGYRAGGITFPFIDKGDNVRAIQVKQFDQANHTTGTDFLHSVLSKPPYIDMISPVFNPETGKRRQILPDWNIKYRDNDLKVSCLFGEHLLSKYPLKKVALVEAPKTAIYGTLYFGFPEQPENFLWLAVFNSSSLSLEKCKALQGRDVYLFPDLSRDGKTFESWSDKAKRFSELIPGTRFEVSDFLEKLAPKELKENGADLADVLIKMDWRKFRSEQIETVPETEQQPTAEPLPALKSEKGENSEAPKTLFIFNAESLPISKWVKTEFSETPKKEQPKNWDQDITELENYFTGIELPTQPVNLKPGNMIINVSLFIESQFATVKANNGKRTFLPYLNRLQELKQVLISR